MGPEHHALQMRVVQETLWSKDPVPELSKIGMRDLVSTFCPEKIVLRYFPHLGIFSIIMIFLYFYFTLILLVIRMCKNK